MESHENEMLENVECEMSSSSNEDSDTSDEELIEMINYKQQEKEDRAKDLEESSSVGVGQESNTLIVNGTNDDDEVYQDSSDADSKSSEDENGNGRVSKRKRPYKYPRYKENVRDILFDSISTTCDFHVGMRFTDKKQFHDALEDYRIQKGYSVKIKKSDKVRLQCCCDSGGCDWYLWASKPKNEQSFQIKKMPVDHSCMPYGFEHKQRHINKDLPNLVA